MKPPIIYNLFPRLVGHMGEWSAHTQRAKEMGFNWIFINPIQYPGFSGSLYAIKDFYKLNPLFVPEGAKDPIACLRETINTLHDQGFRVIMDLVINHSSKDSELIKEHPTWFRRDKKGAVVSPSAINPGDARQLTVWGDLAEIDNENSPDRQGLWSYWTTMVQYYLDLGFDGFRCDAAYKVPAALWDVLIEAACKKNPEVVFFAETLGCRIAEVKKLQSAGFHYLFNSSKWWNFDAPWCLSQHEEFGAIAPSISFPESHDTPRLMQETGRLIQVQKMRYAISSFFSAGVLMPIGYEYGFVKRVNVCNTTPDDWEDIEHDLSPFIKTVNQLKNSIEVLSIEGRWQLVSSYKEATIVLCKTDQNLKNPVLVLVNKDWKSVQRCELPAMDQILPGPTSLLRIFGDQLPIPLPDGPIELGPAEVVLMIPQ